MNRLHRRYCASAHWRHAAGDLVAWAIDDVRLGGAVLELGPGPGVTTAVLRARAPRVTTLDNDAAAVMTLRRAGAPAGTIVHGDAAALPFGAASFSAVAAFTMLHHVPSPEAQDRVLAEAARVLIPGGTLVGCDVRAGLGFRLAHLGDTYVPVDPTGFVDRLRDAGFADVRIAVRPRYFRFRAVSVAVVGRDRVATTQAERG